MTKTHAPRPISRTIVVRTRAGAPGAARPRAKVAPSKPDSHEGATEAQTGDRTGPGAGYDIEPEQVKDKGGVV